MGTHIIDQDREKEERETENSGYQFGAGCPPLTNTQFKNCQSDQPRLFSWFTVILSAKMFDHIPHWCTHLSTSCGHVFVDLFKNLSLHHLLPLHE